MIFVKNVTLKMWFLWNMRFWQCDFCEQWDFEHVSFVKNVILKMQFLWKMWFWNSIYAKNVILNMWFLWYVILKMRFLWKMWCEKCDFEIQFMRKMWFWKCDFCKKWDYESAILKMWILLKMRFCKYEFLKICNFEHVNLWIKCWFLPQCADTSF